MNAIYLKRDTYVVCTFQMNTEPRKFIEDRPNANVSKGERMLLTTEDRNLDSSFICKKPMNQAGSFLALGAGILLVVATGPIGWVACGFLLVGLYFLHKSCTHDCSNPLKAGSWRNEKNGVYFNGGVALPLTYSIPCIHGLSPPRRESQRVLTAGYVGCVEKAKTVCRDELHSQVEIIPKN